MKITNVMGLPEALVRAVEVQRHNQPGRISVTTLLKGTKEIVLTDRHWNDIEVDVADLVNVIFGTAVTQRSGDGRREHLRRGNAVRRDRRLYRDWPDGQLRHESRDRGRLQNRVHLEDHQERLRRLATTGRGVRVALARERVQGQEGPLYRDAQGLQEDRGAARFELSRRSRDRP